MHGWKQAREPPLLLPVLACGYCSGSVSRQNCCRRQLVGFASLLSPNHTAQWRNLVLSKGFGVDSTLYHIFLHVGTNIFMSPICWDNDFALLSTRESLYTFQVRSKLHVRRLHVR